jgi:predicted cobalt transporter CbtA
MNVLASMSGAISSLIGIGIALIFAVACSQIARGKRRSPLLWGVLGFFFSVITLIVIVIMPRKRF